MPFFILRNKQIRDNLVAWIDANWERYEKNPLMVEIAPEASKRTDRQLRYYWASLADFAEHARIEDRTYSKDVWHEHFRDLFLEREELPNGKLVPKSTSRLTVAQFNEYLDKINLWTSTELGIQFGHAPEDFGGF